MFPYMLSFDFSQKLTVYTKVINFDYEEQEIYITDTKKIQPQEFLLEHISVSKVNTVFIMCYYYPLLLPIQYYLFFNFNKNKSMRSRIVFLVTCTLRVLLIYNCLLSIPNVLSHKNNIDGCEVVKDYIHIVRGNFLCAIKFEETSKYLSYNEKKNKSMCHCAIFVEQSSQKFCDDKNQDLVFKHIVTFYPALFILTQLKQY